MEEEYKHNFYAGADYGFDPSYGKEFSLNMSEGYHFSAGQFGLTTDPRNANQLKAVADKLNTGAKAVEVTAIQAQLLESIPNQHLDELNKLRKLTGVDLTFHGPIVEPTGLTRRGWDESHREQAERQMWSAVERAHRINPDGNVVVTFHAGAVGANPEERVITEVYNPVTKKNEVKEIIKNVLVIDEGEGDVAPVNLDPNYFASEEGKAFGSLEEQRAAIENSLKKRNKELWYKQLQGTAFHANQGADLVEAGIAGGKLRGGEISAEETKDALEIYKKVMKEGEDIGKALGKYRDVIPDINNLVQGDIYLRDAYQDLQNMFNKAYEAAQKSKDDSNLKKLNAYRAEIKDKVSKVEDIENAKEFSEIILEGVKVLRSIDAPRTLKPLNEFAVDKSSDTFSNIALSSYGKFKDSSPILSIENAPAGTAPLSRAEDLRLLIEKSREKLQQKLMSQYDMSKEQAKFQAEKLIGVTWDVGHINMIRKFGYSEKDVVKETEKIAPFVKHIHLSDNFGMEHTELPMGMGNVPTKQMLEVAKLNKKVKKIVETGNWYEPFKYSPLRETFRAFGSPIYAMAAGPTWSQASSASGGYSSGYGRILPEVNFSTYGSGFSSLPAELGGQVAGRSRVSGAPID